MPRVSKKVAEPATVAPASAPSVAETVPKKTGVRFGKMTEEHKAKLAEHKDASKHFKASLRGNLMIGKTYEEACERAKAYEAHRKEKEQQAK